MTTLQQVELGVLGPLQVRRRGAPVAIPGAKPRAILTMLGLHGGSVVSADTLVELLWGEDPPRTAAKALQTHISSLRRTLGDGFVMTEGAGWTLAESEVDASRYKAAARLGRNAAAAGDTGQAVARFEEALALWRGIPELPDGRRGTSEKTRWIEGHAALVEDRADALLATGRAAEIIGELEAAVADAPLRERRWGQLMLALYRAGRQGEALGAYQRARTLLADELGVDPGPNLRRLEAAIVAQDAALETPVAQHVPAVTRAVTFLLTDIEGSTAAWEADADAMAVALARHDELVEQVVTSRGGRLIKTRGEGDATFSVFDRPSAAAAAAIELQEAIVDEPWALREPISIRVALHTGEAELRDGDYFGRAVNRAARLRSLAVGGQILCSGATAELVIDSLPDDVVLADLGMRQLKNLARPEHVFELQMDTVEVGPPAPTSDAPIDRPDLPAVLGGPGPFVGRGRELGRLFSAWQSVLTGGTNAMLIAGEPGVGKTRLAGEWSRQAYDQGALVIYGRCDEDLGAPYQPFAEALRSLVPCLGTSRLRGLRGVEALLPLVPGLTDVLPDLATPTRADPDTERYALFDAVVALLGVTSANAPVVLILDDLHWAAKPTLLLLRHILRFGEQDRVQIVGTYRSTDLDRSHPLAAMLADLHRDGTADRLQLSGLDEDDVTAYVAEAGYDDEELARALASVTGGNPFFLIEALRHVDESGGHWDPSTLPQGVREAVSRRLSRLPAETNKALAAAAVVGSRFALDLVERVVGGELVDAFDEACKAGIIIEEPGGRYRFNHAIVRQSLLAELPSVRRMRLHQRIATTLENEPGADDELLAELAHHYFECAWAGNAIKAVEYCMRAADQAMARLAYEGAADLYDRALHALEEVDDELPNRDEIVATLLIARCEALLAAGDVSSAAGAVSQLQEATRDSARLTAWATCFDGQLSMLIHPERLDEVEAAVGAAAGKLAELEDAAGEAMAHTVRAGCLARLGRIGDCEIALDDALTAARRAREHRRVNAVLAGAPLAALWGPNPVPRAGGRCLDVVRLLRITTDSPAVEATSTRCQAVLEAFRGRAAAARRMIDSARRTVTELGLRHAFLEVQQFAGIVELVGNDPEAAEPRLRQAYNGFRRMGLDADTAETAALLGRTCLALGRDAEADELCTESERLAGHALKPSIAWRSLRARLLSRGNDHDEARRVAEAAVSLAERTDLLVDHGDACLTLAMVLGAAGNAAGARAAAERAADLYERKGAAALAERARALLGERAIATSPAPPEPPIVEFENACVRAVFRLDAAIDREDWDEVEQQFATEISAKDRRKVVGFPRANLSPREWASEVRRIRELGACRRRRTVVALRGERLALTRLVVGGADPDPGAPEEELFHLFGLDAEGKIALHVAYDIEDIDAAMAELDAAHALLGRELLTAPAPPEEPSAELVNTCVRVIRQSETAANRDAWEEMERIYAPDVFIESRRKIIGFTRDDLPPGGWPYHARRLYSGWARARVVVIAIRGERLALTRLELSTEDEAPGAPHDEALQLYGIDNEGRISLQVWFDIDDVDAAFAELDATHARFEQEHPRVRRLENAASQAYERSVAWMARRDWDALTETVAEDVSVEDRRRVVNAGIRHGRNALIEDLRVGADIGFTYTMVDVMATRGERLALVHSRASGPDPGAIQNDAPALIEIDADGRVAAVLVFDLDDFEAAIAELDARYVAGEAAAHAHTWSVIASGYAALSRNEMPPVAPDCVSFDHRRGTAFATGELIAYFRAGIDLAENIRTYVEVVHRLSDLGAVCTHAAHGISKEGFEAEWRGVDLSMVEGGMVNRSELFDEADVDAALAKFEQLSRPAPRLENAASQAYKRIEAYVAARDWDAITEIVADDLSIEDHRRVVNSGTSHGRDAGIEMTRAAADVGFTITMLGVMATRGARLALTRVRASGPDPGAAQVDAPIVVELDSDGRIAAIIMFDLDDFEAAIAELDARYLAGEAAAYSRTWSLVAGAYAATNRHEITPTTPDLVSIDHRRGAAYAPGDLISYIRAGWDLGQDISTHIEAVHRLDNFGAVVTHSAHGTSQEGFDAEWRGVQILTVEGDVINRSELFDEEDVDTAIARFDQLNRPAPRLENAASQAYERFRRYFSARDWAAMADLLTADTSVDDHRRVVNAETRRGRDVEIENMRAFADIGALRSTATVIATRGERLVLCRTCISGEDHQAGGFRIEFLIIVETTGDKRILARVAFDLDDFDAAIAELDARYLAGEAAAHARAWSVIAGVFVAHNRREIAAVTPDVVSLDHRRGASFAPGEGIEYIRAGWDLDQTLNLYIETAHRVNDLGAVVTLVGYGTSHDGFDAEWRGINLMTVDGEMLNRGEVFDEADLDAALAKFDQLSLPTPRLENAASRVGERFLAHLAIGDWDAMAEILADNFSSDDRCRVVGAGVRRGRDAEIVDMQAMADLWVTNVTWTVMATRGERLVLTSARFSDRDEGPQAFLTEVLSIIEIDADERIVAVISFDLDDIDAAFDELDARYLASEAAAHSHTWSVIKGTYAAFNRHELTGEDSVIIDHRRGTPFASGNLTASIHAIWDLTPDLSIQIEAVHRLSNLGAVVTQVMKGTSRDGFDAEWREIGILTVGGDLISRVELFDEADLDSAIARFEQLSRPAPRLENATSHVAERFLTYFAARDWIAMAELLADDCSSHDRRRVVGAGVRHGRDAQIADLRVLADLWITNVKHTVIATRGERLTLTRTSFSGRDHGSAAFLSDVLNVAEINAAERILANVSFDLDDIDAAFEELDARYLAGEAAAHSDAWSVITGTYASFNRHDLTEADWAVIDHRRGALFASSNMIASVRAFWDQTPDLTIRIEAVHRVSDFGAVVTHTAHGTSPEGFDAEWRMIQVLTLHGDRIGGCELFDEEDIDAATARFDQLSRPVPQLENAASRADEGLVVYFAARDWDAAAETLADNFFSDDRRHVVNVGLQHGRDVAIANMQTSADLRITFGKPDVIATRGERLVLSRARWSGPDQRPEAFHTEVLNVVEINADERVASRVMFDANDIDAAFAELDARYLAGEAAAHSHTWSVIARECATFNRHELPAVDWVTIDYRHLAIIDATDPQAAMGAVWDVTPDLSIHIEAVHQLSNFGAVATYTAHGTSPEGFDAEWRMIYLLTVEGDLINRLEIFDEEDLDAALARFEELQPQTRRLENKATRAEDRFFAYYKARDWAALAEILTDDTFIENRTPVVSTPLWEGRDVVIANMQALADAVANSTSDVVAIRGERLALTRNRFPNSEARYGEFVTEQLIIAEIDTDDRIAAHIVIDPDDMDAAIAELDARYLAGEAATHAHTWSVIAGAYATLNRHEVPAATPDCVIVDHRPRTTIEASDLTAYLGASWDLTPELSIRIEAVHRLSDLGAVVTHAAHGTSPEGLDAEWRMLELLTVEGDLFSRCELFDEAELDAALARFDELQPQTRRLKNAVAERFLAHFAARDWDALAQDFAEDYYCDDRRRVVNAGVRDGRAAAIEDLRVAADIGLLANVTLDIIATRGERLILTRWRGSGRDHEAVQLDVLQVIEHDADERIAAAVVFDLDDFDAAIAELDARYLAGEAATRAHAWSVIMQAYAAANRHEIAATSPNLVNIDHRRLGMIESGDMIAYLRNTFDDLTAIRTYPEAVHRLTDIGAVVTHVGTGTSEEGFYAEWRAISLIIVEDNLISRGEMFDEADLDAALARFGELQPQVPRLENTATQVTERFLAHFAARNWAAIAEILAEDFCIDDRRRVVNAGFWDGRDIVIANMRALDEGGANITWTVIATRGERLALTHICSSNRNPRHGEFGVEMLGIAEINREKRFAAHVLFDLNDMDAAFEELDARYLAGEAAAHSHAWSAIARECAAFNRHELPAADWVTIDQRQLAIIDATDPQAAMGAIWDVTPDLSIHIEAVHRLSSFGAVVTYAAHGTSPEGFDAEWRMIHLLTVEGDRINRCELFDEADLDAALARFEELQPQSPRPENAASQVEQRFLTYFGSRNWDAIAELIADDFSMDDRRPTVNAGVRHGRDAEIASLRAIAHVGVTSMTLSTVIAIRGGRLALGCYCVSDSWGETKALCVLEINAENQIVARVGFDPDDLDAAFEELDARYLAGEAAAHSHTWSVIAGTYGRFNRHEFPATTTDSVFIDHRLLVTMEEVDLATSLRAAWDVTPDVSICIEAVHRLSELGAVVTQALKGTSPEGFNAEWRMIEIFTVEGDLLSRCEMFDEADLDAALARFDELSPPTPPL